MTNRDRDAPGLVPPQQRHEVIAVACSHPPDYGVPMTHWSLRTLAPAVCQQGLVDHLAPEINARFAEMQRHGEEALTDRREPRLAPQIGVFYDELSA